jgi:uncharacterized Ntn-hydrolase superfamily protein
MTFSIVGRSGDALGVAVASRFVAVGSVVPAAAAGIGAVATQAMAKVSYKADVLQLLRSGHTPQQAVAAVTAADPEAEHRQLGVVSMEAEATFTGSTCLAWAGGRTGHDDASGYAVQGNILVGPEVVDAMERAWLAAAELPLPRRLLAALAAGDEAGGDARGRQGAALYAVRPGSGYDASGVLADLRIDDHPEAVTQLGRLLDEHELVFGSPTDVEPLTGALAVEVAERLRTLGHDGEDVAAALAAWAAVRNLEMRMTPDGIDARVLTVLREATSPR